jgi:hypothetical protein
MDSPTRRIARRRALGLLLLAALAAHGGCGENAPSRICARILDRYRKVSGAKPLPAGGMIRLRLASAAGAPAASGAAEILWEPRRYRESVSSAGMTTVRGIESGSGKAYFTDEDGVTRVASEPVLRELLTRSYFWRRAWLFSEYEGARVSPGPADDATVSVRLLPEGGNPLLLVFSRRDGGLVAARSPRFRLEFSSPRDFRDLSDPEKNCRGEIAWTGLPTGLFPSPEVGGGRARFDAPANRVAYETVRGMLIVPATVSGQTVRLAIDGAADGPMRLSPELAARLNLSFSRDVYDREIAPGASLTIGGAIWPALFAQRTDVAAGVDAVAGGCIFREAVTEVDPTEKRYGIHDPAKWTVPNGFFRIVTDDDGDLPVAILYRGTHELRLVEGSDTGAGAAMTLAPESAARAGLEGAKEAGGLRWGLARLPPVPLRISGEEIYPDWGDDGRLGWAVVERFHTFLDMPNRWTYIQPLAGR